MRIFQTLINLLTLAAMLMQIYSGIILSRHVFAFLPIQGETDAHLRFLLGIPVYEPAPGTALGHGSECGSKDQKQG